MKIIQKLKEVFSNQEHQSLATLNVSGAGFTSNDMHIAWSDIIEINTYKIDNLTYDEVILEFLLSSGLRVRISEEHPDFVPLEEVVAEQFPSTSKLRQTVLQPPLSPNYTNIYRRS